MPSRARFCQHTLFQSHERARKRRWLNSLTGRRAKDGQLRHQLKYAMNGLKRIRSASQGHTLARVYHVIRTVHIHKVEELPVNFDDAEAQLAIECALSDLRAAVQRKCMASSRAESCRFRWESFRFSLKNNAPTMVATCAV